MSLERDIVVEALPAYEVEEELGRGAWGVVLAGTHRQLGRQVAIKQLPRAFGSDPDIKSRFLSEAKLLASLDHPHIVPMFDFVEHDGMCLLVMERLTGGTVWTRFTEVGFSQDAACAVILAACAGLHYAHQRGVLHRDVKPENMMFSKDGALKVTDFGIAKVVGGSRTLATKTGFVLGTPAYIAPEQALGSELGPATDVYAAGTVLFELLSGELPFPKVSDPVAALYQRVHTTPHSLKEIGTEVHGALAEVAERAIARDLDRRYGDAEQFGRALATTCTSIWGAGWLGASGIVVRGVEGMLTGSTPAPQTSMASAPATIKPEPVRRGRAATHKPAVMASDLSPSDLVPTQPLPPDADRRAAKAARSGRGRPRWSIAAALGAVASAAVAVALLAGGGGGNGASNTGGGGSTTAGGAAPAGQSGAEKVVRSFLAAYNRNDLAKASTYFAREADIYAAHVTGRAAAAAELGNYTCKTTPTSVVADGGTVTTVNRLTDLPGKDCGEFDGTTNTQVFTIVDGKIRRMAFG